MDKVLFDEEKHKYTLVKENGEKIDLVSVTQLLRKHGLSPDYSAVDEQVLKAKAERGKIVHEELENYVKYGEIGFTGELHAFIEVCRQNGIKPIKSEFIVNNEEIAGTVDIDGIIEGTEYPFIGDYKTTSSLHRESVAWQLSLYAYLQSETIYEKYFCFHFPNSETCKLIELQPISTQEIENLLECERNCELYQKRTLELTERETEQIIAIQQELKSLDDRKNELERQENMLKEFLIEKMEETGIKTIDNDYFKITYVAPSTREMIDSARLKKELPEVARQFLKINVTKPSIRITLKEV